MKKLLTSALIALATQSVFAGNLILNNQTLTIDDPMYNRVDETGVFDGNGDQVNYRLLSFYVTQSGTYDLEMAIRSSNQTADTYLFLYDGGLNPLDASENFLAGNDDSSDSLTVLVGDYHISNQGRSRIGQFNLLANHQYQTVMTSFDFSATFFQDMTYDLGIGNGQGDVIAGSPVPEPTTLLVLGSGAVASLLRKRRKKN